MGFARENLQKFKSKIPIGDSCNFKTFSLFSLALVTLLDFLQIFIALTCLFGASQNHLASFLETLRSSRPEMFCEKGALKYFTKFTGKHLCQSLLCQPEACNFIKIETLAQVFSCKFCDISESTFFLQNTSGGCFLTLAIALYKQKLNYQH